MWLIEIKCNTSMYNIKWFNSGICIITDHTVTILKLISDAAFCCTLCVCVCVWAFVCMWYCPLLAGWTRRFPQVMKWNENKDKICFRQRKSECLCIQNQVHKMMYSLTQFPSNVHNSCIYLQTFRAKLTVQVDGTCLYTIVYVYIMFCFNMLKTYNKTITSTSSVSIANSQVNRHKHTEE